MRALLKRLDFIAYILIGMIIGLPSPSLLWARGQHATPPSQNSDLPVETSKNLAPIRQDLGQQAPTTPNSKPNTETKLRLVVLELNHDGMKPKPVEKVTDTLRDELNSKDKFLVISKETTRDFFSTNPNLMQRIDASNPLNRYIEEAKEFYRNFHFNEAIGVLSNTIDTYRAANPPIPESFLIVDAYVQLGDIYMGDKKKKDAKNTFKEAVRLDPERELSQKDFSPKTVNQFISAKQEALAKAKTTKLDIFTNPKNAEVFINGINKGFAPIKIDRFTQGDHFILAKKSGYKPIAKKITIKSNYQRVKMDLVKDRQITKATPGLNIQNLRNIDEQVQMAGKVGKLMNADKVVLVSIQEIGYNNKITTRMIDMKYYASHKPKSVEVLNLPKDTRSAASVIANDLVAKAELDLGKNPKKYADSEVIVIGKKKKRSFLKSPLLWSLLGVVIAGGATAGILLSTGGGGVDDNSTTVSVGGVGAN